MLPMCVKLVSFMSTTNAMNMPRLWAKVGEKWLVEVLEIEESEWLPGRCYMVTMT
jgi:hypothetical protein